MAACGTHSLGAAHSPITPGSWSHPSTWPSPAEAKGWSGRESGLSHGHPVPGPPFSGSWGGGAGSRPPGNVSSISPFPGSHYRAQAAWASETCNFPEAFLSFLCLWSAPLPSRSLEASSSRPAERCRGKLYGGAGAYDMLLHLSPILGSRMAPSFRNKKYLPSPSLPPPPSAPYLPSPTGSTDHQSLRERLPTAPWGPHRTCLWGSRAPSFVPALKEAGRKERAARMLKQAHEDMAAERGMNSAKEKNEARDAHPPSLFLQPPRHAQCGTGITSSRKPSMLTTGTSGTLLLPPVTGHCGMASDCPLSLSGCSAPWGGG